MNDKERKLWLFNDEGLYRWWKASGLNGREFIKRHRAEIDEVIRNVTSRKNPPHYLACGPDARQ